MLLLLLLLQDGIVSYYDLHATLLKEFTIHWNYILTEKTATMHVPPTGCHLNVAICHPAQMRYILFAFN